MNDALPGAAAALGWFLAFAVLILHARLSSRRVEVGEHRTGGSALGVLGFGVRPRLVESARLDPGRRAAAPQPAAVADRLDHAALSQELSPLAAADVADGA
jgi:hypothetical protein